MITKKQYNERIDEKINICQHAPFLAVCILFVCACLLIGLCSYETKNHHLVYTHDDAYIHMALAKNIALHNVFGVSLHGMLNLLG